MSALPTSARPSERRLLDRPSDRPSDPAPRRGLPELGLGIGWRPQLANLILSRTDLGFVEVLAEAGLAPEEEAAIGALAARGVRVVVHGLSLGLGGADAPDPRRLERLGTMAARLDAPIVSEHAACVRGGGLEVGHLLPLRRTRDQLEVLVANVAAAQRALPAPLAVEHVAAVVDWPDHELDEGAFLTELCERTGCHLLVDLANLVVNCANHGGDPSAALARFPLERVAYVHVAGGTVAGGLAHDTHRHPMWPQVDELLAALVSRAGAVGVMLERDGAYPDDSELADELDRIVAAARSARTDPVRRGEPEAVGPAPQGPWTTSRSTRPDADERALGARRRLAAEQATLVAAVVREDPPPAGVDRGRSAAAAASLRRKRAREAAEAWPHLARVLGDDFGPRFAAWARTRPMTRDEVGPRADGLAFAREAVRWRDIDADAAAEQLDAASHLVIRRRWPGRRRGRSATVRHRRGPILRVMPFGRDGVGIALALGPSPGRVRVVVSTTR